MNQPVDLHILITWHLLESRLFTLWLFVTMQKRNVTILQSLGNEKKLTQSRLLVSQRWRHTPLIMQEVIYLNVSPQFESVQ